MMIRFSKRWLERAPWGAALCAMLLGSFLYIGTPSFAVGTLIAFLLGPLYLVVFLKTRRIADMSVSALAVIGFILLLSVTGLLVYPSYGNAQYVKAFAFAFFSLPIVCVVSQRKHEAVDTAVVAFIAIICVIAIAQLTFLYFGFGIDPTRAGAEAYVAADPFQRSGPRSIFANPNDFAAVGLLLTIFVLYKSSLSNGGKAVVTTVLTLMILFAASRICVVGLALVLASYYLTSWRRWKYAMLGACMAVAMFVVLKVYSDHVATGSYWFTKLSSIGELAMNYKSGGVANVADGSARLRLSTYGDFFSNFWSVGLGSFKAQDYGYFLSDELMRQDPHSLMVELSLLYGYVGFLSYWFLMLWVYRATRRAYSASTSLVVMFVVIMATFTSSSEVNFPAIWILLYMCCVVRVVPRARAVRSGRIGRLGIMTQTQRHAVAGPNVDSALSMNHPGFVGDWVV